MSYPKQATEFDRNLIAKADERSKTTYLYGIENPTPAYVFDTELVQRAKNRSDVSYSRTQEIRTQKLQSTATLKKNWSITQKDKKNRIIRDLQYEITSNRVLELRKTRSDQFHNEAQRDGIDAFELSLFKSGLGNTDNLNPNINTNFNPIRNLRALIN